MDILIISSQGSILLPVQKDLEVPVDPWFVVEEATNLPGGNNTLLTKPVLVSDTLSEALNVLTKVLLKYFPLCYPLAFHSTK